MEKPCVPFPTPGLMNSGWYSEPQEPDDDRSDPSNGHDASAVVPCSPSDTSGAAADAVDVTAPAASLRKGSNSERKST